MKTSKTSKMTLALTIGSAAFALTGLAMLVLGATTPAVSAALAASILGLKAKGK